MTDATKLNGKYETITRFDVDNEEAWKNALLSLQNFNVEFVAYEPGQFPGFKYPYLDGEVWLFASDSDPLVRYVHYTVDGDRDDLAYGNLFYYQNEDHLNRVIQEHINNDFESITASLGAYALVAGD